MAFLLPWLACAPRHAELSLEPGVSLKGYRLLIAGPVENASGYRFAEDIKAILRQTLVSQLRAHGLRADTVPDPSDSARALYITSRLDAYHGDWMILNTPHPGISRCEFSSQLRDARTNQRLGRVSATYLEEDIRPIDILTLCARAIADELEKRVR